MYPETCLCQCWYFKMVLEDIRLHKPLILLSYGPKNSIRIPKFPLQCSVLDSAPVRKQETKNSLMFYYFKKKYFTDASWAWNPSTWWKDIKCQWHMESTTGLKIFCTSPMLIPVCTFLRFRSESTWAVVWLRKPLHEKVLLLHTVSANSRAYI